MVFLGYWGKEGEKVDCGMFETGCVFGLNAAGIWVAFENVGLNEGSDVSVVGFEVWFQV